MRIFKFLKEVKAEIHSVAWPTNREVFIISGVIAIVILITSLFFLSTDYVVYNLLKLFWNLGG